MKELKIVFEFTLFSFLCINYIRIDVRRVSPVEFYENYSKMKNMKTMIWDYNGTILDDAGISCAAENMIHAKRGKRSDFTVDDYRGFFNIPMIDYYYDLGYTFTEESFSDICNEFHTNYDQLFDQCTLCPGVLEKLLEADKKGYQNIILSSCENTRLHEQCSDLGISQYFKEIIGVDNYLGGSKTEKGRQWMESNKINPEECLYVGDTVADYRTAAELGIDNCVLVAQGHQSYERLLKISSKTVHSLYEVNL